MDNDKSVEEILQELSQEILENILLHQEGNVPFDKFLQQLDTYYRKKFAVEFMKYLSQPIDRIIFPITKEQWVKFVDDIKKVLSL